MLSSSVSVGLSSHLKGPTFPLVKPSVISSSKVQLDPFTLSKEAENEIIHTHNQTHDHLDQSFDEDSLFILTQNVLNPAVQIIDKVVKGNSDHGGKHKLVEKNPVDPNFKTPLCTLKSISSELSCKHQPGEEHTKKTALTILEKLSDFKWEAKAVLTLAAFAYDFGDFWLFADRFESDIMMKQFASLKNVPQLIEKDELIQKHGTDFQELSSLIKKTMKVVETLDKFEQLSRTHGQEKIPQLSTVFNDIPLDVYWTIVTIAATATKFSILTREEPDKKPYDIAPYAQKIHTILRKLEQQLEIIQHRIEEGRVFNEIDKTFGTQTPVVVALRTLLFHGRDQVEPLFNGSTHKTEDIDVLKGKKILLFISTLQITREDVETVGQIYQKITEVKEYESYKIVWVPIVEEWSKDLWNKIDDLRVEYKLPFYIMQQRSSAIVGINYIKEKWNFKGKPTIVKLGHLAEVIDNFTISTIRRIGVLSILFDEKERIPYEINWFASVFRQIEVSVIQTWIKEGSYFFIYGGEDNELIQQLSKKLSAFKDVVKIGTEPQQLEKIAKGGEGNVVEQFWSDIQQLLIKKAKKSELDDVTQDIQKLLSFRTKAWAVLIKGSTVITTYGPALLKVVEEIDIWKELVNKKDFDFEATFNELYAHVPNDFLPQGYQFDLPVSLDLKCPGSSHLMEINVTYKCSPTNTASSSVLNAHP